MMDLLARRSRIIFLPCAMACAVTQCACSASSPRASYHTPAGVKQQNSLEAQQINEEGLAKIERGDLVAVHGFTGRKAELMVWVGRGSMR